MFEFDTFLFRYTDSSSEYIQIDLGEPLYTAGIRLQGNPNKDMWVTKYKVATSLDGQSWSVIQDKNLGIDAVFAGSSDRNTAVDSMFDGYKGDNEIRVHFIRIIPVEFHGGISLRFEVLSCKSPSSMHLNYTKKYLNCLSNRNNNALIRQTYNPYLDFLTD